MSIARHIFIMLKCNYCNERGPLARLGWYYITVAAGLFAPPLLLPLLLHLCRGHREARAAPCPPPAPLPTLGLRLDLRGGLSLGSRAASRRRLAAWAPLVLAWLRRPPALRRPSLGSPLRSARARGELELLPLCVHLENGRRGGGG